MHVDARLNNMGGWSHNFGLFVHVFDGETIWRSVERRRGFEKNTKCGAEDDLDEYLASLNYKELALLDSKDSKCESQVKDNKSEVQRTCMLLQNLIYNNNLDNATININVNLSNL